MSGQLSLFAERGEPDACSFSIPERRPRVVPRDDAPDHGADIAVLLEGGITARELRVLAGYAPGRGGRSEANGCRTLTFAFAGCAEADAFAERVCALTSDPWSYEIVTRTEAPPPPKAYSHHCERCGRGCNRLILEPRGTRGLCGPCANQF